MVENAGQSWEGVGIECRRISWVELVGGGG